MSYTTQVEWQEQLTLDQSSLSGSFANVGTLAAPAAWMRVTNETDQPIDFSFSLDGPVHITLPDGESFRTGYQKNKGTEDRLTLPAGTVIRAKENDASTTTGQVRVQYYSVRTA